MSGFLYKSNFYNTNNIDRFIESTKKLNNTNNYDYMFNPNHLIGYGFNKKRNGGILRFDNKTLVIDGNIKNKEVLFSELENLEFKQLDQAFSLVFVVDDEVLLVRDIFGIKPLYYSFYDNDIIVSTEIKSILEYTNNRIIDDEGLSELIGMGPSHSLGKTIYKGIYELKPGNYLKFNKKGYEFKEYYKLPVYEHKLSYLNTCKLIRKIVDESVKDKIKGKKVSSLLSGGLDSTVISSILADNCDCLDTYSINYLNQEFKETKYEKSLDSDYTDLVSAYISSHHNNIYIDEKKIVDYLNRTVKLKDGPNMTDIDSSLLYLLENVNLNHELTFSGECSDELFGGYPWFKESNFENFPWIRNLELKQNLLNSKYKERINLKEYVKKEYNKAINEAPISNINKIIDDERKLNYINIKYFMLNLIDRNNYISKGTNIEIMAPFCDKTLVELLYNVPLSYKSKDGINKKLLIDSYSDILPIEVINRKKSPFPKSNSIIYKKMIKELLVDTLKDKNSVLYKIFDIDKLNELIEDESEIEPFYGQLMGKTSFFAYLYQIDYWFKEYKMRLED